MEDESKNSDDFEDEDYVEKCKNKKDQEECKTCGNYYSKDHDCKENVARKPQDSTKSSISKTLGKHKRDQSNIKSPMKQISTNKRTQKQTKKANNIIKEEKAYVRVNEALKVVIPSTKLQEFKEDFNNGEDVLAKN